MRKQLNSSQLTRLWDQINVYRKLQNRGNDRALTKLFHTWWRQEKVPDEFKYASVFSLYYKLKGSRQICNNHKGYL